MFLCAVRRHARVNHVFFARSECSALTWRCFLWTFRVQRSEQNMRAKPTRKTTETRMTHLCRQTCECAFALTCHHGVCPRWRRQCECTTVQCVVVGFASSAVPIWHSWGRWCWNGNPAHMYGFPHRLALPQHEGRCRVR